MLSKVTKCIYFFHTKVVIKFIGCLGMCKKSNEGKHNGTHEVINFI